MAVIILGLLVPVSFARNLEMQPRRAQAVLYKIKPEVTGAQLGALNAVLHARRAMAKKAIKKLGINLDVYSDNAYTEEQVCTQLMSTGAVAFAEPDYCSEPALSPNDPYIGYQWQHTKIDSFGAWDTTTGSFSTLVAVCDGGINSTHPDLEYNMQLPGYNTVDGSTNTEPVNDHGTKVAGCIGAVGNNSLGVAGVAWDVRILPIRISNSSDGWAYYSDAAEGIRYAADQGVKAVNLSYLMAGSSTIDYAAQYLRDAGGLLFVAAGNNGEDPGWPDFTSFISVGATTSSDTRASWSNFGTYIDIVAPGSGVYSTSGASSYGSMSGTSFASPIAAGVAALLYSINPTFTPQEIEGLIFASCADLGDGGDDNVFGHGRIDAAGAVALATESQFNQVPVSVVTATPTVGVASLHVAFDGTLSNDPDGDIVSYAWNFGDGSSGSGAVTDHIYASDGTYTAKLTITDNAGASAWDTVQIMVEPDSSKRVYVENIEMALASVPGGDVAEARVAIVDLDGSPFSGAVVTGTWSGPKSSTAVETTGSDGCAVLTSLKAKDTFTYTFTVTDVSAAGYTYDPTLNSETTDSISNEDLQNKPPVAAATADPTSGSAPLTVNFVGSGSYDDDGQIVSYEWNFGDDTSGSGATVSYIYETGGTYTATLTVTDDQGSKDSKALAITVFSDSAKMISVPSIDLILVAVPGGTVAQATVMVQDSSGSPLPGATVTGEYSGIVRGTVNGDTGSDGKVVLTSKKTRKSGTITFTITGISLIGYTYDSALNNQAQVSILTP